MSRRDIEAGRAYVTLNVNSSALVKGLQAARKNLQEFSADVQAFGRQLLAISASVTVPMGFALRTFASFDDSMRQVKAVTGAADEAFLSLTDTAMELGRTTSFTAVEIASLMAELGRAGFKPKQIENMTGAVLNLARATGTDATLASGIMAASIRQFGLAAEDSTRVADSLAATANKTFNTVEQLGEALNYAGKVAHDNNVSFEDTLAILGGLGNVGIHASNAGTVLRRLLTLTGAEAQKLQGIFGVSFADAAGNARPLVDVLGEVNEATKDLGTAARAEKFNEAFGLLGITGASAIGSAAGEIKALAEEIKAAGGNAAKAAAEMDKGLGGAFRMLMSAAEGVQIAVSKALEGVVTSVVNAGTELLAVVTRIVNANGDAVVAFAKWAVAIGAAGTALVAMGLTASVTSTAIGGLLAMVGAAGGVFKIAAAAAGMFSIATKIVDAAVVATGLALAVASGSATGYSAAITMAMSLQAAYPAVAAVVVGAISAVSAAFSGQTLAAGVATLAMSAYSVVASTAAAAAASFWAAVTAPAAPFVAVAAVVVGVVGAIGTAAAIAAAKAIDFSGAIAGIKERIASVMGVLRDLGGVMMSALQLGEYQAAVEAGWIAIRLAFWSGVQAAIDALKWLFSEGWRFTTRFFSEMLRLAGDTLKHLALAITNPLKAASEIGTAIGKLASGAATFSVEANTDAARAELAALREQMEGKAADKKVADAYEAEVDAIKAEIDAIRGKGDASTEAAAEEKATAEEAERARLKGLGLTDDQIARLTEMRAEAKALAREAEQARLKELGLTEEAQQAALDEFDAVEDVTAALRRKREVLEAQAKAQEATAAGTEKYDELTDAIYKQIIALQEGERAAERYKMQQLGLTDAQIASVEALRDQQNQLEQMREASKTAVEGIAAAGDRALARGMSPQEIAEREKEMVKQGVESGRIDEQTAQDFNAKASERAAERMEKLREEARKLNEELRQPQEILNDRLKKIAQLQEAGVISERAALLAEDRARADQADRPKPQGAVATFSAAAALAASRGSVEDAMVREQKEARKVAEKHLQKSDQILGAIKDTGGWMVFG